MKKLLILISVFTFLPLLTPKIAYARRDYSEHTVQPIIIVPKDQKLHGSYQWALTESERVIRDWYIRELGGKGYTLKEPRVSYDSHTLKEFRCGIGKNCSDDDYDSVFGTAYTLYFNPNPSMITQTWVIGAGGAVGGAYIDSTDSGFVEMGDWSLDAISELGNNGPTHGECAIGKHSACSKDSQRGAIAHELGHAFGLDSFHQDSDPGNNWHTLGPEKEKSIMSNWAGFPNIGLLDSKMNPEKSWMHNQFNGIINPEQFGFEKPIINSIKPELSKDNQNYYNINISGSHFGKIGQDDAQVLVIGVTGYIYPSRPNLFHRILEWRDDNIKLEIAKSDSLLQTQPLTLHVYNISGNSNTLALNLGQQTASAHGLPSIIAIGGSAVCNDKDHSPVPGGKVINLIEVHSGEALGTIPTASQVNLDGSWSLSYSFHTVPMGNYDLQHLPEYFYGLTEQGQQLASYSFYVTDDNQIRLLNGQWGDDISKIQFIMPDGNCSSRSSTLTSTSLLSTSNTCRDNPTGEPPSGAYWKAACDQKACQSDSECDSGINNQKGWCYGFAEGNRCLKLISQADADKLIQNSYTCNNSVSSKTCGNLCGSWKKCPDNSVCRPITSCGDTCSGVDGKSLGCIGIDSVLYCCGGNNQQVTSNTTCQNYNPPAAPANHQWTVLCDLPDCTNNPDGTNNCPKSSDGTNGWCYGFPTGNKCMRLDPAQASSQVSTPNTTGTTISPAGGTTPACNPQGPVDPTNPNWKRISPDTCDPAKPGFKGQQWSCNGSSPIFYADVASDDCKAGGISQVAGSLTCQTNPPLSAPSGMHWVADCSSASCNGPGDCQGVNGAAPWCYGFVGGAKCLQLQPVSTQAAPAQGAAGQAAGNANQACVVCDKDSYRGTDAKNCGLNPPICDPHNSNQGPCKGATISQGCGNKADQATTQKPTVTKVTITCTQGGYTDKVLFENGRSYDLDLSIPTGQTELTCQIKKYVINTIVDSPTVVFRLAASSPAAGTGQGTPGSTSQSNAGKACNYKEQCSDGSYHTCVGSTDNSGDCHYNGTYSCDKPCPGQSAPSNAAPYQPNAANPGKACNPGEANIDTRQCSNKDSCEYSVQVCNSSGTGFEPRGEKNCDIGRTFGCAPDPAASCPEQTTAMYCDGTKIIRKYQQWINNQCGQENFQTIQDCNDQNKDCKDAQCVDRAAPACQPQEEGVDIGEGCMEVVNSCDKSHIRYQRIDNNSVVCGAIPSGEQGCCNSDSQCTSGACNQSNGACKSAMSCQ